MGNKLNDLDFLQKLSDWMHKADVHEVNLEDEDRSVHIVRRGNIAQAPLVSAPVQHAPAPVAVTQTAETSMADIEPAGYIEKSPMVGVAYLASSPNDPPFIEVGKSVKVGDPLLIIEAMKVMNQIQATKAGIVKQILVQNGEPIEFDQPLMRIE